MVWGRCVWWRGGCCVLGVDGGANVWRAATQRRPPLPPPPQHCGRFNQACRLLARVNGDLATRFGVLLSCFCMSRQRTQAALREDRAPPAIQMWPTPPLPRRLAHQQQQRWPGSNAGRFIDSKLYPRRRSWPLAGRPSLAAAAQRKDADPLEFYASIADEDDVSAFQPPQVIADYAASEALERQGHEDVIDDPLYQVRRRRWGGGGVGAAVGGRRRAQCCQPAACVQA